MRPPAEYTAAIELIRSGKNDCAVARTMGIPRETVRDWRRRPRRRRADSGCAICGHGVVDRSEYAYLLGLYLGDGCLSKHRRDVFTLRVSLDARYPGIIDECAHAIGVVAAGRRVCRQGAPGCIVVQSYWKHWPCLFPQHGPGPKHLRRIVLAAWQQDIAKEHPARLLRGLIHSDGCRVLNHVNGKDYPRYSFSNMSADIHRIFCSACDGYGVSWTRPSRKQVSIARAPDVAKLDLVIGPKR